MEVEKVPNIVGKSTVHPFQGNYEIVEAREWFTFLLVTVELKKLRETTMGFIFTQKNAQLQNALQQEYPLLFMACPDLLGASTHQ